MHRMTIRTPFSITNICCCFLFLSILFLWMLPAQAQDTSGICEVSISVASGREDGRYFEFVSNWSEAERLNKSGLCIENTVSSGSRENLRLLAKDAVGFALIQNDIGHNAYYGKRGYALNASFSGLSAIYKEYVQIVYRMDNAKQLNTISDLAGKRVAAGNSGSGGYWNAMDLLQAAGLEVGFHFQSVDNGEHPISMLNAGLADVAIYTSSGVHPLILKSNAQHFGFIELPKAAITRLAVSMKRPYYDHGSLEFRIGEQTIRVETVAVHAYLVTANSIKSAVVERTNQSLDAYLQTLLSQDDNRSTLEFLQSEPEDLPFDMHYLANKTFGNRLIATMSSIWVQAFLSITAIVIMIGGLYMRRQRYSSVGLIEYNSFLYLARQHFITFSQYALGFAFWLFWLWIVASIIVDQEHRYADARGFESPLEGIGLLERVSWLVRTSFTTLPGEVPLSPAASILIPVTVLLGLGAFIYPVVVYFTAKSERDNKKNNGQWNFDSLENHVLICGWNERVPGVIYSLISEFTPVAKKVVVVAETPDLNPLVSRGFDPSRVMFVRGNAANTEVLRRAGAPSAAEAIVMACDTKISNKNVDSILTVIALRKLSESNERLLDSPLFIGAELINAKNKHAFSRAGVDSLVNVEDVADKICAANLLSLGVADFVTDFLTFDNHFEIYSKPINRFPAGFKAFGKADDAEAESPDDGTPSYSFSKMRRLMIDAGKQLIGYTKQAPGTKKDVVVMANEASDAQLCSEVDRLIYFSVRKNKLRRTNWQLKEDRLPLTLPELNHANDKAHLVIIGDPVRTARITKLLGGRAKQIIQIDSGDLLDEISNQIDEQTREELLDADSILLLDGQAGFVSASQTNSRIGDYADTASLLIVKFLNDFRTRHSLDFKIVAEAKSHSVREIFRICGAQDLITRNSLIERLLAKMVFNHGKMYEVVAHLLSLTNGVHIRVYDVEKGDDFVNQDIRQLMLAQNAHYQVCGWLPKSLEEYLKLDTMGTDTHYITAFDSKYVEKKIAKTNRVMAGDKLVLMVID